MTTTHSVTVFADPHKRCRACKGWVTGATDMPGYPLVVNPCGHMGGYDDVCPSWGPVDGCTCPPGEHGKPDHPAPGATL